jgi:SAM-dependent methyltransferase
VQVARKRGLSVHEGTAEDLLPERSGSYDAICSFQVLEHVATPGRFLEACTRLLSSGGRLLLGLPDSRSFLGRQHNLLDLPPHHMTRWCDDVMRRIPDFFPLRLDRIAHEVLPEVQIGGYVDTRADDLARLGLGALMTRRVRNAAVRLVRLTAMRHLLRGQSLYAAYTRL